MWKDLREKDHVFFVEVLAGDLDGARFHAERHEAGRAIELGSRVIVARHGQHQLFQAGDAPRVVDHRLQERPSQSAPTGLRRHVHRHDTGLMSVLLARLAGQAHDTLKSAIDERAPEHVARASSDSLFRGGQRLLRILLVARRECVGVLLERAQPQLAERDGIGAREDPYGHSVAPFR